MAYAQQLRTITGTVRDEATNEKMSSVNVSTGIHGVSTVTNSDGKFIIKVPSSAKYLIFTCLGYKTNKVGLQDSDNVLKIRMMPENIPLSEIVIESPENIVQAAIRQIPFNYPDKPELAECFYRETTQRRHRFIYIAEAVTSLYKTSYLHDIYRDRLVIVKGRRLVSPKQADTLGAKVQGGPNIPIFLDIVKNSDFMLNENDMSHYSFSMELPEEIDGRPQIVVSFKPKDVLDYPLFFGKYYIDRASLAFTRAELSLDMHDPGKATRMMLINKPHGVRFKPYEYKIEVDYRTTGNITRISYVNASMSFKCDWRRKLFSSPYTVTSETVVTSLDTLGAAPKYKGHSFSRNDSYYDHDEYFKDDSFWEDYNIIAPTENLDKAIDRILKKRRQTQ